jgi:hypothetical protein
MIVPSMIAAPGGVGRHAKRLFAGPAAVLAYRSRYI